MGPIDYLGAMPQQDFLKDIQGGLQLGVGLQQARMQAQQQQLALQQAQQYQADAAAAMANPNPQAFAALALKYPQQREAVKQSWDALSEGDRKAEGDTMAQAYSALLAGKTDIAKQVVQSQIDARKNSGLDTSHYDNALAMLDSDPKQAQGALGFVLSHINDPKAFATQFGALGGEQRAQQQAPATLAKAQADAVKAGADAQVAVGTVPALIQKPTEENLSAASARRVAQYNAEIAAANSETQRGQLVLERDKFIAEQKLKGNTVATDTQNQFDTIGQSIDLVKTLRTDPLLDSWFGVGSTTGKLLGYIPGTENKDFRARVETLKSQQFLTAAKEMKGMGALSDAEGARIERAVASLDTDQSKSAFKNALGVIETTLKKGQAKLIASGKLPTAGGAFVMQHPTFGPVKEGDINRLMTQYPGSTREQVIQFLQQSGGK